LKHVTLSGAQYLICRGAERAAPPELAALADEPRPLGPTADAIFILHKGCDVDSNRKGEEELFGCPSSQVIEELEATLRESGRMASALHGQDFTFGWQSRRPDGSPFHIECTVSRVEIEGHRRLLTVAVDATSRGKSERTLAQLSGRLLEMQDEERRRIARDLHDTTGQNLGALSINLSMILTTCTLDPHARETLEECIALTDSSIREIRTLSYLLHPPLLDELGLVSALRAYSEGHAERTGLEIELDLPVGMPRLPQAVEIALFRIVQEGLANIHRHSGSHTAILRLKYQPKKVELEIADRGRGLPPGTLEREMTSASRIGVGIAGMRERARQLRGHLTIGSSETGTTLHVVLPLPSA
jgi:signal transduction histidine kinase